VLLNPWNSPTCAACFDELVEQGCTVYSFQGAEAASWSDTPPTLSQVIASGVRSWQMEKRGPARNVEQQGRSAREKGVDAPRVSDPVELAAPDYRSVKTAPRRSLGGAQRLGGCRIQ
jgi:hypothetical protein